MSSNEMAGIEQLRGRAAEIFASRFGEWPCFAAAAPGRVNLIGEHTDYNRGHVLPIAIERWCVAVAAPSRVAHSSFMSTAQDEILEVDLGQDVHRRQAGWTNYVLGAARQFQDRGAGLTNINAVVLSSVPVGSGLSSSAALCVAIAMLFEQTCGVALDRRELAALCQRIEHDFAGVPCGIMDQTASIMARGGHALHLDCFDNSIEHVPMPPRHDAVLFVVDTRVRHNLATNEYGLRRKQCEQATAAMGSIAGKALESLRDVDAPLLAQCAAQLDPVLHRRARHVISENDRVLRAIAALRARDLPLFGELMYASHDSLRDDYEVSCNELDRIVESARAIGGAGGVFGARMTGGGFGGCAIVLCHPAKAQAIVGGILEDYARAWSVKPEVFMTAAAEGATALSNGHSRPGPA